MKYAIFSDDFLSYFRLDDNGETLVLTDKRGFTRAVKLLPCEERPQGEWIENVYTEKLGHGYLTHHDIVCSVCGGSGENDEGIPQNFNFCPHCGARMEMIAHEVN